MTKVLFVALGGAVGSIARYGLASGVAMLSPSWGGSALGVFVVNAVGCFAMGALSARAGLSDEARLLLGTGLLGGFTTYSAFNAEVLRAAGEGRVGAAALNVAGTLIACLAAGLAGAAVVRAAG